MSQMGKLIISLVDKHIDERDRSIVLDLLDGYNETLGCEYDDNKTQLLERVLWLEEITDGRTIIDPYIELMTDDGHFHAPLNLEPIISALCWKVPLRPKKIAKQNGLTYIATSL